MMHMWLWPAQAVPPAHRTLPLQGGLLHRAQGLIQVNLCKKPMHLGFQLCISLALQYV
jgi:hypothetical protein